MYVKKSISLLLSGALFASLCTGCSQTTMEHHFFADTETETEYITPINEIDVTTKIIELENLLTKHEIELEVYLSPSILPNDGLPFGGSFLFDDSRQYSDITKANLVEEIDDFIAGFLLVDDRNPALGRYFTDHDLSVLIAKRRKYQPFICCIRSHFIKLVFVIGEDVRRFLDRIIIQID